MENLDLEWVETLRSQLVNHILYSPLEARRAQLEPGFQRAMAELPPEPRQEIGRYLHAIQQLDVQLTHMAYQIGIQYGERRNKLADSLFPKKPKVPSPEQLNKAIVETALRAKDNPHYKSCLARVEQLEPHCLSLQAGLSPEVQKLLTDYFAATKELYELLVYTACDIAR